MLTHARTHGLVALAVLSMLSFTLPARAEVAPAQGQTTPYRFAIPAGRLDAVV